jgi:rhodanese-related sulfurtransferase
MAVPRISKEELKHRLDDVEGARPLLIDVRLKYPYEHSTITLPGAIRMGPRLSDVRSSSFPPDRDLVLYDSDPEELVAERAAAALIRAGYRAFALRGGISEWAAARFPVDRKPAPQLALPVSGAAKG